MIIIIMIMPTAQIYFEKEEDEKIVEFHKKWNISKHDVVKRIVREFKEEDIKE